MPIVGGEGETIAQARRARDVLWAAVDGDRDEEVIWDLALVPAVNPLSGRVDATGGELGLHPDASLPEEVIQVRGCDGLGEGSVQGRDERELDPVPQSALSQLPVGEEAELQRGHGTLDRHVDHVDHEPAPVELLQGTPQGAGTLERVEGV